LAAQAESAKKHSAIGDAWLKGQRDDALQPLRIEAAKSDEKVAHLEDQLIQEKDKLAKKDKAPQRALHSAGGKPAMIDIGNYLAGGDPNRVVHDKLDILHVDLRAIISNTKDTPSNPVFPTS
jgi:hypothetical protein